MMIAAKLLAVMVLLNPEEILNTELKASTSGEANCGYEAQERKFDSSKHIKIVSERSDFDRDEGVVAFSGGVMVEYDQDFTMNSDKLYVFANGDNEVSRIVAVGNVAITNDIRAGKCATAVYRRKSGEIEMYGDNNGVTASFTDAGDAGNDIEGLRIKFWIDSEQVEVDSPIIRMNRTGKGVKL